jgi:hypothetical protein
MFVSALKWGAGIALIGLDRLVVAWQSRSPRSA